MELGATATATPLENLDAWTWGWDAVVALGTLSLAVGTAVLAGFTVRLAARTRELAQQSAADLRAQWRPVLLPAVPSTTNPDHLSAPTGRPSSSASTEVRPAGHFRDWCISEAEVVFGYLGAALFSLQDQPMAGIGRTSAGPELEVCL